LNYSLVSAKNLSPSFQFGFWIGDYGLILAKVITHLWCHPQKTQIPKTSNFKKLQTRRLAASFEGLNCSLAQ